MTVRTAGDMLLKRLLTLILLIAIGVAAGFALWSMMYDPLAPATYSPGPTGADVAEGESLGGSA